jgi:peroxiredoxin
VLLFFWTTWCPYCLQKVKFLNEEYLTLEKNNIALLAINAGEARKLVARLAGKAEIMYKVLLDERGSVSEDYRIGGVPTFILIDKEGKIRYKGNSYPQSDIESVIAQK